MKLFIYVLLFLFSFLSCSDKKNEFNSSSPTENSTTDTIKSNDIPNTQTLSGNSLIELNQSQPRGISTSPDIEIIDGKVELNLHNGVLLSGKGENIKIIKNNQINGILNLKDAIKKIMVNGVTVVSNANIIFTPETPLQPNTIYNLVFIEDQSKKEYKERITISVANNCNPSSLFSKIPIQNAKVDSGDNINLEIKKNIYQDASQNSFAIIAWDHFHSNSFYFRINNRTEGAKYKIISALGTYNIPGHECELYFQRDINYPFPTWADTNYGSKVTKITKEDTTFINQASKEYYVFAKTFVILKVFDSSNVDITANDTGILSLQQTDSLYGLPISYNEDESSLLAYLNKGNNNSYSMVLGGLIVGIFGFFLSRRLMKKGDEI